MVLQGSVESNPNSVIPPRRFICPSLAWLHRLGSVALGSISWLASSSRLGGCCQPPSCYLTLENSWDEDREAWRGLQGANRPLGLLQAPHKHLPAGISPAVPDPFLTALPDSCWVRHDMI